jgi:hypothetical protein
MWFRPKKQQMKNFLPHKAHTTQNGKVSPRTRTGPRWFLKWLCHRDTRFNQSSGLASFLPNGQPGGDAPIASTVALRMGEAADTTFTDGIYSGTDRWP